MSLKFGNRSDVGLVRKENEDNWIIFLNEAFEDTTGPNGFILLADGLGGHEGGREASRTAVETIKNAFEHRENNRNQKTETSRFIANAFREAHQAVTEKGEVLGTSIKTTLTGTFFQDQTAYIGHIGDSRAYLIRGKEIFRLTEDHTLGQLMLKQGKIKKDSSGATSMDHMLMRCLGSEQPLVVDDPLIIDLNQGDVILLCTDGLTKVVRDEEILSALHNTPDMQSVCDFLVELTLSRGAPDNVTVVAAEYGTLHRIQGLGERADTVGIKRRGKRPLLIVGIGILTLVFLVLMYVLYLDLRETGKTGYQSLTSKEEIKNH